MTARTARVAVWVEWTSIAIIVVGLLLVVRQLPWRDAVAALEGNVDRLGLWGPALFGLVYALATVLFVPGWILTVAAGGIFGLVAGLVTVSVGSTAGAAAAFLIARSAARRQVEALARRHRRFRAVDEAVGEGGWRIVVLLRLSPAIPFNLQNYLYGLTRLRFGPYVLASWLAMLPGAFLWVYLGHVAGTALDPTRQRTAGEWIALGVGLAATVVLAVYLARTARERLRTGTAIEEEPPAGERPEDREPRGRPWAAVAAAVLAVLVAAAAAYAQIHDEVFRRALTGLFGPPAVTTREAYEPAPGGPSFDHGRFDALLREHVDEGGWVDYAGLGENAARLREYVAAIGGAIFAELGRDEKLALLINAYNAFTLQLILEHAEDGAFVDSIRDIPAPQRWEDRRWRVGAHTWSLNQIEHEQIRPKFAEPRIHFALVCAAVGCPPLRREAYAAGRLDAQLEDQARTVHGHERWFRYDLEAGAVQLTSLYDWYRGDFEQAAGSVLAYTARYAPALDRALSRGEEPAIRWIPYDWRLNSLANRESTAGEELPQVKPLDEHVRARLREVRPSDWSNPQPARRYNLVVVGGGTAGLVTAAGAAGLGAKVALVERDLLGGDCLNVGCVPSKALIRSSRALVEAREAGRYGVRVPEGVEPDFPAVMERVRRLRARISPNDSARRFAGMGVDVFLGPGRFTGPDRIDLEVHLKPRGDRILGALLVSRHAGETVSELTAAMTNRVGLGGLGETIHPYPTQAEIIRKAADQYDRTRVTPRAARLLRTLLSLRRRWGDTILNPSAACWNLRIVPRWAELRVLLVSGERVLAMLSSPGRAALRQGGDARTGHVPCVFFRDSPLAGGELVATTVGYERGTAPPCTPCIRRLSALQGRLARRTARMQRTGRNQAVPRFAPIAASARRRPRHLPAFPA